MVTMRARRRRLLLAPLVLGAYLLLIPGPAAGFGTIEGGGQHREHERITRAALACPAGGNCFQARSVDQLAGHDRGFGAVGAPDRTEVDNPAAHCDDADFLTGGYPQTRDQATQNLVSCVEHLRLRLREAVRNAGDLLDEQGRVVGAEVGLDTHCALGDSDREQRAKCTTLESFGRALHGVQDFYAHSSWTDRADPARPIGADNPPGLNLPAPSPVLDLRGTAVPAVPADLSTGCFVLRDSIPGTGRCERRVTHAALNKDNGLVDPGSGRATNPTTPRGMVGDNFARAVAGAVVETRHQWQEFQSALDSEYGRAKAAVMACALARDDPLNDCPTAGRGHDGNGRTVALVLLGVLTMAGLGLLWSRSRHRPSR